METDSLFGTSLSRALFPLRRNTCYENNDQPDDDDGSD